MRLKKVGCIAIFLLLSVGFRSKGQPVYHTGGVDSIRFDFIRYALRANHQTNALKEFNEKVRKAQDTSSIRLFFESRSDKEVSRIDEYRHLIVKINELKKYPRLTLDSIYEFYRHLNFKNDESAFRKFTDSIDGKYISPQGGLRSQIPIDTGNYKDMDTQGMVQKVRPFSGEYWEYLLCITGGALVIALFFQIRRKEHGGDKRRNTTTIKEMQDKSRFNGDPEDFREVIGLKDENTKLRRENEQMREELHEKNALLKKAERTIAELENGQMIEEELLQNAVEVPVESRLRESIKRQYFPSPLSDGSFRRVDGRESFLEGASIYCFRLSGDTEASFDFCEEISSVSMALNNRNELILSVAEEMEGNYTSAKKITTYKGESGRAVLEDNKWNVVRKIKIKYL